MKSFEVTYKHGHFIDMHTKSRIIPIQDEDYVIIGNDFSFDKADTVLILKDPLSQEAKASEIEGVYGKNNSIKILNAGEQLIFRLGNSKRAKGDKSLTYYFVCNLLEDLYIFKLHNRTGNGPLDWRLVDCQCELDKCVSGGLVVTETLRSESLNKLFCNTVMHYFRHQRSGSINVFNNFLLYPGPKKLILPGLPEREYDGLSSIRNLAVKSHNIY